MNWFKPSPPLSIDPVLNPKRFDILFIISNWYRWAPYSVTASSKAVNRFSCCNSTSTRGYP